MASGWQGRVVDGRYALEELLGEGGMGVVYRARHQVTGGEVALKLLHPHIAAMPDVSSRFLAEARAPAAIGHAGIVRVTDAGKTPEGELYLVMELLRGATLRHRIEAERMPHDVAFRLTLHVLDALGAAHAAGIVHRDLKPENIFLEAEGRVPKLLDFGIAKVVSRPGGVQTATGSVMGTVAYMSPEQLRDTAGVDQRADLWAVAVVLFELLTGRRPFDAPTESDMLVNILSRPAPPPSSAMTPCAPEVDAFFARAFTRDPAGRFASAQEMAAAVAALAPASARALSTAAFASTSFAPGPQASQPFQHMPVPSSTMRSAYNPLLEASAPRPPRRGVPIAVWIGLGLFGLTIVSGAMALAFILIRPPSTPSIPTRHTAAREPSHAPHPAAAESDDALCERACEEIERCTSVTAANCRADCARTPEYKACVRNARPGDCRGAALCALGAGCNGRVPAGRSTCKQAADCEFACSQHHGNAVPCLCGCIQQLAPDRAIELAANNICVGTNCAAECKPPMNAAVCGLCVNLHCKVANQSCLAH